MSITISVPRLHYFFKQTAKFNLLVNHFVCNNVVYFFLMNIKVNIKDYTKRFKIQLEDQYSPIILLNEASR